MMYTVRRTPIKVTANVTRRAGPTQIDIELRESSREFNSPIEMSSPRPVFNGKKSMGRHQSNLPHDPPTPPPQAQHEDTVKFVADMWYQTNRELEMATKHGRDGPVLYQDKKGSNHLQGFVPFDLHQWWGNRTLENIHKTG